MGAKAKAVPQDVKKRAATPSNPEEKTQQLVRAAKQPRVTSTSRSSKEAAKPLPSAGK